VRRFLVAAAFLPAATRLVDFRRAGLRAAVFLAVDFLRAGLRAAVDAMDGLVGGRVMLGGQSYGGRQATMLAADEPDLVAGLLLFSYPLHPPGKPERPRTEHFPKLRVSCLFVQGTADPFGSPDELRAAIAMIPAPTELIPVERAGHDLKSGRFDFAPVVATALRLCSEATPGRG